MEEASRPCQAASGRGKPICMAKPIISMTEAERRKARLAEALRANLARRKARARAGEPATGAPAEPDHAAGNSD